MTREVEGDDGPVVSGKWTEKEEIVVKTGRWSRVLEWDGRSEWWQVEEEDVSLSVRASPFTSRRDVFSSVAVAVAVAASLRITFVAFNADLGGYSLPTSTLGHGQLCLLFKGPSQAA